MTLMSCLLLEYQRGQPLKPLRTEVVSMSYTPALTRAEELELVKGLGCSFATAREGDYEPIVVMLDDFLVRVRRKLKAEFGNDWKEKTKNIRQRIRIQYD